MKEKKSLWGEFCNYKLYYCQNFVVVVVVVVVFLQTVDEFNELPFLNDNNELLRAEDLLYRKFPIFSVHFEEYFSDFSSTSV